jgi:hypothetical protein
MDKEELKEYVISLGLGEDIESILLREIDSTEVINQDFINRIADILYSVGEAYERNADMIERADEIYDKFEEEINVAEEEAEADIAEIELESDEQFLSELEAKVKELESKDGQQTSPSQPFQTNPPTPPAQNSTTPPINDATTTTHPSSAILNRPIQPPGIIHSQTGPNISILPFDITNLNPNPVE